MKLGLSLGLTSQRRVPSKGPLCDAIARKVCVSAVVKKRQLTLAPHIVYVRHGDHRVTAVVVEEGGDAPNKPKLEAFKVADVTQIELLDRSFTTNAGFDPDGSEYGDEVICVVQVVE